MDDQQPQFPPVFVSRGTMAERIRDKAYIPIEEGVHQVIESTWDARLQMKIWKIAKDGEVFRMTDKDFQRLYNGQSPRV